MTLPDTQCAPRDPDDQDLTGDAHPRGSPRPILGALGTRGAVGPLYPGIPGYRGPRGCPEPVI